MKRSDRNIFFILTICVALVLSGCGQIKSADNNESLQGGYVEEEVNFPDLDIDCILGLIQKDEESVELYITNRNGLCSYKLMEDGYWSLNQVSWVDEFNKLDGVYVQCLSVDKNDNVYVVYTQNDHIVLGIIENGKALVNVELEWKGNEMEQVSCIQVTDDHKILLGDNYNNIAYFDCNTGDMLKTFGNENCGNFVLEGQNLYVVNYMNSQIEVYELTSNTIKNTIACDDLDKNSKLIKGTQQGEIYLISKSGIMHKNPNGELWECIYEGQTSSLGLPLLSIEQAVKVDDKFYVLFVQDRTTYILRSYVYRTDISTSSEKNKINIYMLEENPTLKQALIQYQMNNPTVKLQIQVGIQDGVSKTDAINQLNVQLMSGGGPDLILLDGLPIQTYINNGVLADVNEYINDETIKVISKDIDTKVEGKYGFALSNIINAFKQDNKMYAIPAKFTVPIIWGRESFVEQVNSLETIEAYMQAYSDEIAIPYMTAEQLIREFYMVFESQCLGENREINEEQISDFLEKVKGLAYSSKAPRIGESAKVYGFDMVDVASVLYHNVKGCFISPLSIKAMYIVDKDENHEKIGFNNLTVNNEAVFEPICIMGINASSKHKEEVTQVMAYALADKIQGLSLEDGLPVNKSAFERYIRGDGENKSIDNTYWYAREFSVSTSWKSDALIDPFAEICKTVRKSYVVDQSLMEIILEEANPYFEGSITLEEAVENLTKKLSIYLKE